MINNILYYLRRNISIKIQQNTKNPFNANLTLIISIYILIHLYTYTHTHTQNTPMFTKSAVCDLLLFICIISSTSAFFLQPNGLRNKPIRHKSTSIFSEPPTKSTIKSLITREFLTHRSPDSERREAVAAHLKSSSSYPGYANLFTSALADLGSEMQAEARLEYGRRWG